MGHSPNDSVLGVVARIRLARRDQLGRVFLVVTVHASVLRHVSDDLVGVFACPELPDSVIPVLLRCLTLNFWQCRFDATNSRVMLP